jgi:hypothetical protein
MSGIAAGGSRRNAEIQRDLYWWQNRYRMEQWKIEGDGKKEFFQPDPRSKVLNEDIKIF